MNNIEELIQKISQKTGLSRVEIKNRIEQKKEELGFFVNDIAAAHIIAKDLNVPLSRSELQQKPKITIQNLKKMEPGLSGVSITGRILRVYNPIEFVKQGSKGVLASILLHDGTDSIRTILWGNMARMVIEKKIERGSVVRIEQAYTRKGLKNALELHVGDRGAINLETSQDTSNFPDPDNELLNIDTLDEEMQEIDLKATVYKVGNLVTFTRSDGSEGRVSNLFLKGKNKNLRIVFWDSQAEQAFNYTRGDELLIQAANVKLDREGNPELHAVKSTYVLKVGHISLPELDETPKISSHSDEVIAKKIREIKADDGLISLIVRKGPETDTKYFNRKDGTQGSVKRVIVYDETGEANLVLWDDTIKSFDSLNDGVIQINKLRINLSRYETIELHTIGDTELISLKTSEIPEDPPIQDISTINPILGLASVQGVIQNISSVREFNRSDGSVGRVASMSIQDTTGICRIVAWDDVVGQIEDIQQKEMKFTKIFFGRVKQTDNDTLELHLSLQSHIRPSLRIPTALRDIEIIEKEDMKETFQEGPVYQKIQLSELAENEDDTMIEILGKLIRVFQQTPYYWACSECRKKVVQTEKTDEWICATHNVVKPKLIMRVSGLLDDGTSTIKATFFGLSGEILTGMSSNEIKQMISNNLPDEEIFQAIQKETEGKTLLIQGRVRLQIREVQDETMQSQTLFVNRVFFPSPKSLVTDLVKELQE